MCAEARGEPFTRAAMQESADGQRVEQVVALRGERTDNAGQHVAAAALGQRRAARNGDAHAPVRRGDDRAAALQQQKAAVFGGQTRARYARGCG